MNDKSKTTVICHHCGDRTSQDVLLPLFTCGACDEPFTPSQTTMRQRLEAVIAKQDAERGRPLTVREQLANLEAALAEDAEISESQIEAGAHALAARFFWCGTQQKLSWFPPSQQERFRDMARAVLESAGAVKAA